MSDLDVPAGLLACTSLHGLENALCDAESAIGEPNVLIEGTLDCRWHSRRYIPQVSERTASYPTSFDRPTQLDPMV